jgi:uncharacterized protein (DUF433 family)
MARAKVTAEQLKNITDPREMPAYGTREAAHYLQLPHATLKSWVFGRPYPTRTGQKFFRPVIARPDEKLPLLSFYNLAEAHVLSAFRREYRIELRQIRAALDFVTKEFNWKHPLIEQRFETDGAALFIEKLGVIYDASAQGQIVMESVRLHFKRLDWADNAVVRLWPFTRSRIADSPRAVFIDPRVSFGRPSLARCNVPTAVIAERYKAGEFIDCLAADYGCSRLEIEEGLRCELDLKIAA